MSTPTFKLPSGYASLKWGPPLSFTEATYMTGVAIKKGVKYSDKLDRKKVLGETGFVAGYTDMVAGSAGAGGVKKDTEKLTVSFLFGEHATKTWPVTTNVLVISGLTGKDADINGEWSVVGLDMTYAIATEGDIAYELERYCDVDLTP